MNDIRPATPEDAEAIKDLISESLRHGVVEDEIGFRAFFGEICSLINTWAANPNGALHLVYEHQGDIVGIVYVSDFKKLNLLIVHPDHQRTGIGSKLLDHGLDACRRSGKSRRVTLNASTCGEPFYLKYGFVHDGPPRDLPGGCIPLAMNL